MTRPQCSVYIATSLDGFIARPDGGIDWLNPMMQAGEDYGYQRFFASIDAIVFGRKTYETALGFDPWPYAGKRCVVLTHRPIDARHGEERHDGPLAELVDRLGAEGVRRVYIDGGEVIRQFLAAGLVDDVTLSIVPVLLGEGLPLFRGGAERWLRLVESRSYPSGLVQIEYRIDESLTAER
jgi:dihydrofolate reductase